MCGNVYVSCIMCSNIVLYIVIHCHSLYGDIMHKINVVVMHKHIILYIDYIYPRNRKPAVEGERHGKRGRGTIR